MKTYKIKSQVAILFLLLFFVGAENLIAGNYTWNGGSSTSWTTTSNWTPNGTPGINDTVTIVTGSNNVYLTGNTTVKNLTINSGTLNLQTYTLTISGTGSFNSGSITSGFLSIYGTSTQTFKGTQFGAKVSVTGNSILLNGSVFNDSLFIVKKGTSNDNGKGSNTFNGYVSITDSASGNIVLSDSFPDVFNSSLVVSRRSTGNIYLAHRGAANQFNGDVTFNGSNGYSNYYGTATYAGNIILNGNVYFGYGGGSCVLNSGKTISIGASGISAGWLYFKNFSQQDSTGKISLALTGTSQLFFESGSVFNDSVTASAPLLYLNGTRFNGVSNLTNNGSSTVSSNGGCYFKKKASIFNSCTTSITYSFSLTAVDTFATDALIQNNTGNLAFSNAVFLGSVTLKNANTTTASDRYNVSSSGQTIFKGAVTIDNTTSGMVFGNTTGNITFDSTASLSFTSGFTGNITLKGISQLGNNSQNFNFPSASSKLILGPRNTFNGTVNYYGHYIQLNGSTFNSSLSITRYGTSNESSLGGNVFNGVTLIKDSCYNHSNTFSMATTSSDDFNSDVTFCTKGSGVVINSNYTANSTYSGNLIFDASNASIQFGANGGKAIFDGSQKQEIYKAGNYVPVFKKLVLNKSKEILKLNCNITVTDSLYLIKGVVESDTINFITINDNGVAIGGTDSSYIQGTLNKIGNDAFTFPLGGKGLITPYHPLYISAPGSTTESFAASYISQGNALVTNTSTLYPSHCEYWTLKHSGDSAVYVGLNWNANSCNMFDTAGSVVSKLNGTAWSNLGKGSISYFVYKGQITSLSKILIPSGSTNSFAIAKTSNPSPSQAGGAVDPAPVRGLYVNKFIAKYVGGDNILGVAALEDELLEYCDRNNIRRLDLYNLDRWQLSDINPNANTAGNTISDDLCAFITKAKTQHCILEIAAVGSDQSLFDDVNDYNTLHFTPPYILSNSTIPNLETTQPYLKFLEDTYNTNDGEIALTSELLKFYLRINDFNNTHGLSCSFDIMTTELEFWWHGGLYWIPFSTVTSYLRNTLQPIATTNNRPFRIHNYFGYSHDVYDETQCTIPMIETEANMIQVVKDNSDKIYVVDYRTQVSLLWDFSGNTAQICSVVLGCGTNCVTVSNNFVHTLQAISNNLTSTSIISPLFGSDIVNGTSGWWFQSQPFVPPPPGLVQPENHTIERFEHDLFFDVINQPAQQAAIGNSIMEVGSVQWYAYTHMRKSPNIFHPEKDFCTDNVAFTIRNSPELCDGLDPVPFCANTDVILDYCSNYEPGVTIDWDFGDGQTLTTQPLTFDAASNSTVLTSVTHRFNCPAIYTINCTIHFPSGCQYSYSRTVEIDGIGILPGSISICQGEDVTLNACGAGNYTWTPGGLTTTSINVSPNTTTTYSVAVVPTPASGCPATATAVVNVNPLPVLNSAVVNATCGLSNGSITLTSASAISFTCGGITNTTGLFTGLPNGTYQCAVEDANGCRSETEVVDVLAVGGISLSMSSSNVLCNGGSSGSVSVSVSGGTPSYTYLWSNGTTTVGTTANVSSLPVGTYLCTVTDANGCVNSGSVSITQPIGILSASASSTDIQCYGGSSTVTVSATGGTSPYLGTGTFTVTAGTYNFTVTDNNGCSSSTSITLTQPSSVVVVTIAETTSMTCADLNATLQVSATGGTSPYSGTGSFLVAAGTHTYTVTDANGCTGTASRTVYAPFYYCHATIETCAGSMSSVVFGSTYTGSGSLTTPDIVIHNDLTIDASLSLINCNVVIDPNVKIIVLPNCTLNINSLSWLHACTAMWEGIVLSDPTSVIIVDDSKIEDAFNAINTTNAPTLTITNSTFDHNYQSIILQTGDYSASVFYNNTFTCSSAMKSPYASSTQSFKHMVIGNVSTVTIGVTTQPSNIFSNTDEDIWIETSTVELFKNHFSASAHCVYARNNDAMNGRVLYFGNASQDGNNTFTNAEHGIYLGGKQSAHIYRNTFSNHSISGITSIVSQFGNTLNIFSNEMTGVFRGIDCIQANNVPVTIEANSITTIHNLNSIGIRISDTKGLSSRLIIRHCDIDAKGNFGIITENNLRGRVYDNNVVLRDYYAYSNGRFCFLANNCAGQAIDCNRFQGDRNISNIVNTNSHSGKFFFSNTETVSCNYLDFTRRGFTFVADCNNSRIYGNEYVAHLFGLTLGSQVNSSGLTVGGVIGPQTLPNNLNTPGNFYNGYDNAGTFYNSATTCINSNGQLYPFWVNLTNNLLPLTNSASGTSSIAILPIVQTGYTAFSCPDKCYGAVQTPVDFKVDEMEEVLSVMPTFTNVDELTKWLMEKGLYEKLKSHPELIDSSLILENFMDSTIINNKGKFGDVSLALNYVFDESTGVLTPVLINSRISDAETKNDNITPSTIFETNQKIVNSIILSSLAKGRSEFEETELMDLESIAQQCPFFGGPSVYEARSLLLITNPELIWDDDEICDGTSARHKNFGEPEISVNIYPNPAKDKITLNYDFGKNVKAIASLIDVDGRIIQIINLDTRNYSYDFDLSNMMNGVYLLKISTDNNQFLIEKFTVIK